ncbi:hypothetical protein KK488_04080 [Sphingobium sp. H33]|uniref:DUF8021 domain-containing protein n=2 Tax=Sphingobium nicotianae TaxID=2782607 RepID=A0A9X1IPI2_9SPHN|nr:hypothetical protein [Sphingobium nicotianae]
MAAGKGQSQSCDKACLEGIGNQYRAAYLKHDASAAPFAKHVRYSENNVEMPFPDGTWDTVTEDVGPSLLLSDPTMGTVGLYMGIRQRAVPGFLAVRLKIEGRRITEVEHIISTRRNLSSPPTPIGEVGSFTYDPIIEQTIPPAQRASRASLTKHAHGYFDTLQHNDGEIRGTCFHEDATRRENGMLFSDIKGGFKSGRYAFNNRVRREIVLVDEARQVVMARGFIDHKGVLDEYRLSDGTMTKSVFQEPQSWGLLEMFKVTEGCIAAVVATFYQAPYYTVSPWTSAGRR